MRRYTILLVLFFSFTTALFAGGMTEGSTYAKTILEREDDVSMYFKQVVEPYTFKNGPLQMTIVPLLGETYLLSEYPDMKNKRYSTSQMVDQLGPFIKELDSQQERSGAFFVYLRYEQSEELLNTSSFTINPNFFNYMFLDNDRGEYLRVSEFSVTKAYRVSVSNPVYEFWVRFGDNSSERESFFNSAKEISISVTDFGFEGESIKFQLPLSQLFSEMPEGPHEIIKTIRYEIRSSFTVTFDGANISTLYNQSIEETIPEPESPEKSGYTFNGWYKDSFYQEKWDFETDTLIGDTTLYAKWEPLPYGQISFDSQGGSSPEPENLIVEYGASYGTLPEISKPGYIFRGWSKSPYGGNEIDTGTTVSQPGNFTLYASWEDATVVTSGIYYNLVDFLFLFDGQTSKHSMPVIGAGYLAGINYKEHGITLGAGIGLNLMMASDILSPPSAEEANNHYANLTLFLPVVSLNPGVFNLAIITDVSLHDFTWSSKLAAKLNLGWISFSLGVGYFSEAEKFLPYFGFGVLNGTVL